MKLFKLMFLKKKGRLDERGAALANVLLISTFVMVLTSSVLSMAFSSYRMKMINLNSKNNFYSCEAILDQVKVGFRNEMDQLMKTQLSSSSADPDAEDIKAVFKAFYEEYKSGDSVSTDLSLTQDARNAYYDLHKVASLLNSVAGVSVIVPDAVIQKESVSGYWNYSSEIDITVDVGSVTPITVTLRADAYKNNNFEVTDTYAVFHDLTVIYSEYGYEDQITTDIKIEFPKSGSSTVTVTSGRGGWKTMLENRVKLYSEWKQAFLTEEYSENNFGEEVPYADCVYINTTDYPANSISDIMFMMDRYIVDESGGWSNNVWGSYLYTPVYPCVQVQYGKGDDGLGTGGQYSACGNDTGFKNLKVFVGGDDEDEENWVDFSDVFDSNYMPKTEGRDDPDSAVYRYIQYYGDDLESSASNQSGKNVAVKYKVHLSDGSNNVNSRGYIAVLGRPYGNGSTITPYKNADGVYENVKIYVNLPDQYQNPVIYANQSVKYWEKTLNTSILTVNDDGTYQDKQGRKIEYGSDGSYTLIQDFPLSTGETYGGLSNDEKGYYIYTLYENKEYRRVYLSELDITYTAQSWIRVEDNKLKASYYSYDVNNPYLANIYTTYLRLDLTQCGYQVGDVLNVTLSGVDADTVIKKGVGVNHSRAPVTENFTTFAGSDFPQDQVTVVKLSDSSVQISIQMTWDMYQYIGIECIGTLSDSMVEGVDITTNWDSTGEVIVDNADGSSSKDALISYQNWRKE